MQRLLILITVFLLTLWLFKPEELKQLADTGKLQIQGKAGGVILQVKNELNDFVRQKTGVILGAVFSKQAEGAQLRVLNDIPNTQAEVIVIDFSTSKGKQLHFKKNKKYYLDLRNIPKNLCVFINNQERKVKPNQYLQVSFSTKGSYNLYFDECQDKTANFNKIIVE